MSIHPRRAALIRATATAVVAFAMVLLACGNALATEPDDTPPGVPLPSSPVTGTLDVSNPTSPTDSVDWYHIDMEAGDRLKLVVDPSSPEIQVNLYPLGKYGTWDWVMVTRVNAYSPARFTYVVPPGEGGTYVFKVRGQTGSYGLEWQIDREPYTLARVYGPDRYGTSLAISRHGWEDGTAPEAVIASGEDYPDALCASGLAGLVDGPILLAQPHSLPDALADELLRLGTKHVYLIGGTAVISDAVVSALDTLPGVSVERLAGTDRYATARIVATRIDELKLARWGIDTADAGSSVVLVRGDDFPDAVSASTLAAAWGAPMLLTRPDRLDSATAAMLYPRFQTYIIGGAAAVSEQVEAAVVAAMVLSPWQERDRGYRIAGADRYETSARVADRCPCNHLGHDAIGVATGEAFPDALCAGAFLAQRKGCLVLSSTDSLPSAAVGVLSGRDPQSGLPYRVLAPGAEAMVAGGPQAISEPVFAAVRHAIEDGL